MNCIYIYIYIHRMSLSLYIMCIYIYICIYIMYFILLGPRLCVTPPTHGEQDLTKHILVPSAKIMQRDVIYYSDVYYYLI